jgi:uncharacterized protein (DUF885 family)
MRPRHSLSFQIAALNEAIDTAREGTREGLEDARYTIQRVKDQRHLLAMLAEMKARDPELFAALYSLATDAPGTQIADVRRMGL